MSELESAKTGCWPLRRFGRGRRELQFQLRGNHGALFEVGSGTAIPVETQGFSLYISAQEPDGDLPPSAVRIGFDAVPWDAESKRRLTESFLIQLSVLECTIPELASSGNLDPNSQESWNRVLDSENLSVDRAWMPTVGAAEQTVDGSFGGFSPLAFGECDHNNPTACRRRCTWNLPKSEWHRWILRRLTLWFRARASDLSLRRMADYLAGDEHWNRWKHDPTLRHLVDVWKRDHVLQAQIQFITDMTMRRSSVRATRDHRRRPFRLYAGRFVFRFPADRRGLSRAQKLKLPLLTDIGFLIAPGPQQDKRMLAVAIWMWQEHLEKPKCWAGRELSQGTVASRFGFTRSELRPAIRRARQLASQRAR